MSTAPTFTTPLRLLAAFSHAGASYLQWPHQGAKNSINHSWSESSTSFLKLSLVNFTTGDEEVYNAWHVFANKSANKVAALNISLEISKTINK